VAEPGIEPRRLRLSSKGLLEGDAAGESEALLCQSPLRTGLSAGKWCPIPLVRTCRVINAKPMGIR